MTQNEIDAMKLALDALEANQPINYCMNNNGEKFPMFSNDPLRQARNEKAITALKERLADPMREVQRLGQEIEATHGIKENT
jgi:mitochondrial fission protein ELM1